MRTIRLLLLLLLFTAAADLPVWAQIIPEVTLPPGFRLERAYSNLLGLPSPLAGLTFSEDGAMLWVGVGAGSANGAIFALPVIQR